MDTSHLSGGNETSFYISTYGIQVFSVNCYDFMSMTYIKISINLHDIYIYYLGEKVQNFDLVVYSILWFNPAGFYLIRTSILCVQTR